jgi:hypothetical protein
VLAGIVLTKTASHPKYWLSFMSVVWIEAGGLPYGYDNEWRSPDRSTSRGRMGKTKRRRSAKGMRSGLPRCANSLQKSQAVTLIRGYLAHRLLRTEGSLNSSIIRSLSEDARPHR